MNTWKTAVLGDAIEFVYGKSLPKAARTDSGRIPVYGSNGVTGWHGEALVQEPTVIVGRKGSAGMVQYVDRPCFPIDTTYYVRPRLGFEFDTRFLFYLLRRLDLPRLRTATGVPGLTREDAYRERIAFPALAEQRRIVDLLSRAEGIVRLRREAQAKAQAIIPALFLDMFGDPATNPKGWPEFPIEALCSVQTGATPKRDQPLYYDGGTIPWIKTGEVCENYILSAEEHITDFAVQKTNCKVFPVNTILIAMYGQGQTRGRAGILAVPATTNQACAAILPSDKIHSSYLFALIKMQYERLRAMGRGGNQANLNLGMVKSFVVPCPPLDLQAYFIARVFVVESILAQQTKALKKTESTFQSLLARAFSGNLASNAPTEEAAIA